jgi:CopG family nickel-responsive transcriptional regulator
LERFTISLDDELAHDFDHLIEEIGYENRSEAVRDLIRQALEKSRNNSDQSKHCVAVVSYVYNHHEKQWLIG